MSSRRLIFAAALLFAAAIAAHAQSNDPQWRIYAAEGRSIQNYHGQAGIQTVAFERSNSRKTRLGLDFGVVGVVHAIEQPRTWLGDGHQNVPAAGISLLARRRFKADSATAQPYVEISSGPMLATERVPAATSHFNFYSQLGIGYVIHPDRKMAWLVGWRFGHISNAGYGRLNSGLNINSLMIGTQFH